MMLTENLALLGSLIAILQKPVSKQTLIPTTNQRKLYQESSRF